jgi:hypothetical protein
MTYDPLYSIDFPPPTDTIIARYTTAFFPLLHLISEPNDFRTCVCVCMWSISNDNIYLNLSNGIFFILIIFLIPVLGTRVCRIRRFLTLFFSLSLSHASVSEADIDFPFPHSLTHSMFTYRFSISSRSKY